MYGFLKKAQDNLALAKHCLENGYYDASANRAYYAAFQAAIAALAAAGMSNFKQQEIPATKIRALPLSNATVQPRFNRGFLLCDRRVGAALFRFVKTRAKPSLRVYINKQKAKPRPSRG